MASAARQPFARLVGIGVSACALLLPPAAAAQVFRIVGPDGRVTFTDRPPPADAGRATPAPVVRMAPDGAATDPRSRSGASVVPSGPALPLELRNVASRFPVTLYTGADCLPCTSGRNYLAARGIPFTERTVATPQDIEALQRLTGQPRVPVLAVGRQQLPGFSEGEWSQYLDAAGYPRESRLPRGWRAPAPAPLVALPAPAPREVQAAEAPATPVAPALPQPAGPDPANPAGIRF